MWRWSIIFALMINSCVPGIDLFEAPCPCGEGFTCCEILGVCLPAGQTCPSTVPSSGRSCERDVDCAFGEQCASWTLEDGTISGPRVCKRACSEHSCHPGERCLFSLHDGKNASDLAIARLCLEETPSPECAPWICAGCPGLELGKISNCADNNRLEGCLFALHPECGLKCEVQDLGPCETIADPCANYDCARCPSGEPGAIECRGEEQFVCLATDAGTETCDRFCVEISLGACAR
jgi:hypothetical protein